ncbi:MAG: YggS family pyridoxal phosphate-dependent enzyme [Oscillospiraceae bacterium]|nr:YggS family pyridoxal phosphate-dependent enzyme [Oscillospiraceae bacterium]
MFTSIAENIQRLRREIDDAARESGRGGWDILLVGASKMNDAAACQAAIAAGIDALGENRVQEMTAKLAQNAYAGAPLHFIGHLQRNKARQVVGTVSLIHSVDSTPLLLEIERLAALRGIRQDVLLEVNVGGEVSKSGFSPSELYGAAELTASLQHVRCLGLMSVPPPARRQHQNRPYFEKVYSLFVDINKKIYDNKWEYISMGMSDDFADAIACGSNMVRIGTAVFGKRNYMK